MKVVLVECDPGRTLGGSCTRDVNNMAHFIIERKLAECKDIIIMTTSPSSQIIPECKYENSRNLLSVLNSLELGVGGSLFVLLSGHGYSIRDVNGDEVDGMDECINVGSQITDDMLYNSLILRFANRTDVKMLLMSDTCHSGTMFDLPFTLSGGVFIKNTRRNDVIGFEALSLSACSDQQLSMCDVGDNAGFGGSLTVALLEYPEILKKLISGDHTCDLSTISNRLKLLNQTMIISKTK